jgi:hypothetical protein
MGDFEFGIWLKLSRHPLQGVELPNYSVDLQAERREEMSLQIALATLAEFRLLCDIGLRDTLRLRRQETSLFSWWDYRILAFPKNRGLPIDMILADHSLAKKCSDAGIDISRRTNCEQPNAVGFAALPNRGYDNSSLFTRAERRLHLG